MDERAFVLMPMQDIVSAWTHPVYGFELSDMMAKIPDEQKAQPMDAAPQARAVSSAA
jgi:7,8-dihydro-6-hydroxymethylpterin-pyrophosphokinase